MMRKGFMYWLAILLVAVPLLGSFSKEAAAASTRVAIIKELKGTVKVKKAGGSKEFTAFAKMSLNEGDVLAVGSAGSAVLQFANGTSEDDKMTVASNTKLTFSKLSSKKGTTTKVSMWSGSAWTDVKSITNKEDQFTLETPTAVMGVRGTHLLVTVNPDTGATSLLVAAGVVQTTSTGGSGETQNVYPTQNALITNKGNDEDSEITIAPADLEKLMKQGDAEIVKAIIQGAADITKENEQYVERYEKGEVPKEIGGTSADLERFKNNTQNLLGALATQAVQAGVISQERLNQLIDEASKQTGFKLDLTKSNLQLTDAEKTKQEKQRKIEEAAAKRAAESKAKEEAARKKLEETLRKLEEARKAQQKANQEAAEAAKKKAKEAYENQLGDADKKRFKSDEAQRQAETKAAQSGASPSPSPSPSPSTSTGSTGSSPNTPSNNAKLSGYDITYRSIETGAWTSAGGVTFGSADTSNGWSHFVPFEFEDIRISPKTASSGARVVSVNGTALTDGYYTVHLETGTPLPLVIQAVAADNATTQTLTLTMNRQPLSPYPSSLESWTTSTDSGSEFSWTNVGYEQFAGQSPNPVSSFKMSMTFKSGRGVASAKLFSGNNEVAAWNSSGVAKTVNLSTVGLNQYALKFYNGNGEQMNSHPLYFFNGQTDLSVTDLGVVDVSNPDGSFKVTATQSGEYAFAQVSPDVENVRVSLLSNNNINRLYADGSTYPLVASGDGTYDVHLQPGINKYQIVVKDHTGYFKKTYEFTIMRGEGGGSVASYLTQLKLMPVEGMPLRVFNPAVDGTDMVYEVNQDMVPDFGMPIDIVAITSASGNSIVTIDGETAANGIKSITYYPGNEHTYSIVVTDSEGQNPVVYTLTLKPLVEEPLPEYVSSWSIAESVNGAPKYIPYYDDEVGEYVEAYSVAVDELTNGELTSEISLNMHFAESTDLDRIEILDSERNPLQTYTGVGVGFNLSEILLPLNPEGVPYTKFLIEYNEKGSETTHTIELMVLRGDAPAVELELSDIGIGIIEGPYFSAIPYGVDQFMAYAGPETDGFNSFMVMPSFVYEGEGAYPITQLFQVDGGNDIEPEDGMAYLPEDGWYDYVIVVWDQSQQQQLKRYGLHIYKGNELPSPFSDVQFEAQGNPAIGASYDDPTHWYVEYAAGSEFEKIKPSEVSLPNGMAVEGVWVNGIPATAHADGYYYVSTSISETVDFVMSYEGHAFLYRIEPIPYQSINLSSVNLVDRTDAHWNDLRNVAYASGEHNSNATLPNNITQVGVFPVIENDNSGFRVKVDGEDLRFDSYDQSRSTVDWIEIGTGKTVQIEISSPSGYNKETYTFDLLRQPLGIEYLTSRYFGGEMNLVDWDRESYSSETGNVSYGYVYNTEEAGSLQFQFGFKYNWVLNPQLTVDSGDPMPITDYTQISTGALSMGEHIIHVTYTYQDPITPADSTSVSIEYRVVIGVSAPVMAGNLANVSFVPNSETIEYDFDPQTLDTQINPVDQNFTLTVQKAFADVGVLVKLDGVELTDPVISGNEWSHAIHLTQNISHLEVTSTRNNETTTYKYTLVRGLEPETNALLADASLSWGLSYDDAKLIPTGFTAGDYQTSFVIAPGDINEAVTLRLVKPEGSSASINFVELNGTPSVTADVYGDYPLNLRVGSNHFVVRLSAGETNQTYDFYMDALPSHIEAVTSSVEWHYGLADQLYAEVEYGQSQIHLEIATEDGYVVEYSGNPDFDPVSGTWSNLLPGLNTLTVHVSGSGWDKEYTLNLVVGGSA